MKEHGPWKTKNTKIAYESPWIRVDHSEVINPGGVDGTYSTVHFKKYCPLKFSAVCCG